MSGFSSLDKDKKIKIVLAAVALAVGGLLIVNSLSGGAVKEIVAPTAKPAAPTLEPKQNEVYQRQKERQQQLEESGQVTTAGG
ncbi:MAG: hypothetical protein IT435_00415 [Phycisphaerales bacterium]|nr:hypothetical protein [Phycisphaerales bacterium]